MAETFFTFTTDSVDPPETIRANTDCRRVTVQENGDATQVLRLRRLSATSNPIKLSPGQSFTFVAPSGTFYKPNDVVGYISTVSGSAEICQIEEF